MEVGLRDKLSNDSGVAAVVGARIFPTVIAQGSTFPALSYYVISQRRMHIMDGPATLVASRVQITGMAEKYAQIKSLEDALRLCLNAYRGTLSDATVVTGSHLIDARFTWEPEPKLHRLDADFEIWHSET